MRAAIYRRVSTADQTENTSLPEQEKVCRDYAERQGWDVVEVYTDGGKSGTDRERPAWRAMLTDARDDKFDAVVVAALDRFSRKVLDGIAEMNALSELGVTVAVVKERMDLSTIEGRLTRNVLLSVAEAERDRIVQRTAAGQRAKASTGGWPGGQPPYGWRLEGSKRDAHAVPDEGEREVIRLVVGWLVRDGMSTGEVADRLNDLGMPPRKGGRWLYEVVKKTFTNSVLCDGVRVWGTPGAERGGRHTRMDRNGKPVHGDPVVTVLPDPPLSRDEFEAVVAALTRRGNGRPRTGTTSRELTGRLYGDCGRHYTGVRLSHADRFVYRCTGRRHRGVGAPRCSCPQVDATTVEDAVWEQVVALLSNPARLRSLAGEWLALAGAGEDSTADLEFERLAKQVARLERAKINAAREVLLADDPKPYRTALAQVEQELASLQPRLDAATAAREDAAARAERLTDLASLAARAAQRLPSMSHEQRARVLVLLDVKVTMRGVVRGVPQVVEVTGRVDPRLFGPGDEDGSGGGGGLPGGDGGSGAPGTRPDGGARAGRLPHPAHHRRLRRLPVPGHPADRPLTHRKADHVEPC